MEEGSYKEKKKRKRDDEGTSESRKGKKTQNNGGKEAFLPDPVASVGPSSAKMSVQAKPSSTEVSEFLVKHGITIDTPPGVQSPTPIISFSQLHIPDQLRTAFAGFKEPTPIQACTWPPGLEGHDVVGIAETGR